MNEEYENLEKVNFKKLANFKWEDICLENKILDELISITNNRYYSHLLSDKYGKSNKLLLYGPPGTGKTLIAKVIASVTDSYFLYVKNTDILNKYQGESENNLKKIFELARSLTNKNESVVILFDEIDSLVSTRGDNININQITNTFLPELEELNDKIIIIATTNLLEKIDDAIMSRFSNKIEIPLPNKESRNNILKKNLDRMFHCLTNKDISRFSLKLENYSGRDIESFCQRLQNKKIGELEKSESFTLIDTSEMEVSPKFKGEFIYPVDELIHLKEKKIEIILKNKLNANELKELRKKTLYTIIEYNDLEKIYEKKNEKK